VNHDDFDSHGSALLERVREQVDAPQSLHRLRRDQRNARMVAVTAAATVVVVVALLGGLWWLSTEIPPADQPTTTTLRALPVEVSIVLLDGFTIDAETGACSGDGEHSVFAAGASVDLVVTTGAGTVEEPAEEGTILRTVVLPAGRVITDAEVGRLGGSPRGADACRFPFPETGLGIDDFQSLDVEVEVVIEFPRSSAGTTSGQRHTYFYGGNQ
jgi:hypothetical protein